MSAVPVTETETVPEAATAARRRIGDILLELGFATEEQVAEAVAEQEQTGQPLGQILVQRGVITRLELASALAEQWSDQSVSISLLPIPKSAARPAPQHDDDDQYAARLQDAVADLAQRVHATQASNAVDGRVTDLAERIEATVARTQRIEVTLATLAENLEGVTGGVEEAFSGLQAGMAALALDLARIDSAVAGIVALPDEPPSSDPALSERLEELEAAVRALAERPADHDAIADRIEELASRFETLGESPALDDLREAMGQIQVRVEALAGEGTAAELERQSAFLADLRTTVADLEARPVGSPEIDARLERIETGLAKRPDTAPDSAAVDELAARVEATSAAQDAVVASVNALGPRIDEIVARLEHDDGTESRIDDLEARLAAVVELAADRGDHALLVGRLEALESRLASNLVTSDELSRALDGARNELGVTTPEADGRVDQLASDLDALRTDLARARDELGRTAAPEPDSRVDQLAHELDAVRAELARVAIPAPPDPELVSRLELLAGRVEELAADRGAHGVLAGELQALQRRLASDLVTSADFEQAIGEIRTELARPPSTPSASPEAEQRVARLEERLGSLDALSARVDGLAKELESASPVEPVAGADDLRRQIDDRVEELGRTLEERLAATEPAPPAAVEGPEGIEKELERMVLTIERVGLHLGEHDRALAEVMRTHGVAQRLDELAARVDELAAGEAAAVPASSSRPASAVGSAEMHALVRRVEDAEKSSAADREKLMNRLERIASSIDWRLQRLEAGEPTS